MSKLTLVTLIFCVTTINIYARQMIEPNRMQCEQNKGFMTNEGNRCAGNHNAAEMICKSMNAKLPTVKDFDNETKECGGVVGNTLNNQNDPEYKQCIIKKGYYVAWDVSYWTTNLVDGYSSKHHLYDIENGSEDGSQFDERIFFIRCIK